MNSRQIDEMAERHKNFARRQHSLVALNNAISLMAHDYSISEVMAILRDHADQLEEFG